MYSAFWISDFCLFFWCVLLPWVWNKLTWPTPTSHLNIGTHICHTVLYKFLKLLTRRIFQKRGCLLEGEGIHGEIFDLYWFCLSWRFRSYKSRGNGDRFFLVSLLFEKAREEWGYLFEGGCLFDIIIITRGVGTYFWWVLIGVWLLVQGNMVITGKSYVLIISGS